MLTAFRRHVKTCAHRSKGRKYRHCRCPIWVDGFLNGVEMRKTLETRDWEQGQRIVRDWESEGAPVQEEKPVAIADACNQFDADAKARGLREPTLKKYRVLFSQLNCFASGKGLLFLKQWDLTVVRDFRASWRDRSISALKKLERLRAFFRFAHESGWITENPTKKLRKPEVTDPPTMPFTQQEMIEVLSACDKYTDNYGNAGQINARRLRALVLLLRYSGMRIGDTVTCAKDRVAADRLFLYTQKTGVPVCTKLPPVVVEALNTTPSVSERYFFWSGQGKVETATGNWRRSLRKLFRLAGVKNGHPHRFRDTFAVEQLLSGTKMENVSILLGHSSIRVTEKHYAPWVRARQEQLEADVERSWARDPVILAHMKGTREVHGKVEVVN